jgi:hypothetical protein
VHNAYGSPTAASLSGTGVSPVVLSPIALNFGFHKVGSTSASRTIEVTNEQPVALSITSIQTTGDFKQTNNCPLAPATLAAGVSCSVNVTFSPTVAGARTGQLNVSDRAVTSPQTAALSGAGGAVLQSISVTPSTASIAVGQPQQFTATGFYNDGSQKDLTASATWSSSNPKVATVSAGLATGVGAGKAIIRATQSGVSGSATLTVTNLTLTSIAVTPTNPSIALGTQQQFHATGTYSNGSTLDITNSVTWAPSSSAIATITSAGLATSKAAGQTKISATSGTISGSTMLTVTPAQLVAISVTPPTASIPLGITEQFTATGTFTDGTMQNLTASATWTSSQTVVATVTAGLAYPVSLGTTTVTATVGSISGSASLTVTTAALVSITVTPAAPSVALGNTQQFTATGTFTDGSTQNLTTQVSWASANTSIASVNAAGFVMTAGTGSIQISATSGSITGNATLTVTAATLLTIAVTPAIPSVPLGETQQFAATGTFTDGSIQDITQTVSWSSSNPTVASVSMTTGSVGLATALTQGTTTIIATQGTVNGSTTLTVNPAALLSITLSPSPLTLPDGTTQQLVATGKYSDGTTQTLTAGVTWTSSNVAIATVNTSGLVTAVAATGSTLITAQDSNVTGTVVVQVSSAVLMSITISPSTPSIPLTTTQQFTATGTYSDNSTQDLTSSVQWTSSNPAVATISVSPGTAGLAQSLATGSTTITAASGSISGTATLTITPAVLVSISIAPSVPSVDLGRSQQFTATGTYTDGSSGNLTAIVTWSASPATVAVIGNQAGSQGLATTSGVGTASITATLGGVSSSTTLTVGPATIVSIAVTPMTSMISVGLSQQFTAIATYTDGSTNDVTAAVTWSSSVSGVAAMTNNVATGVAPGTATITASSGGVQGAGSLTVFALPLISGFAPVASTVTSGSPITLTAYFANGTGVINPGAIPVTSGIAVNVTPAATTMYTLTVTNAAGAFVAAQTTVTVVPVPVITSFTASAATITAGSSTALVPVFSNGTGVINPGAIAVTSGVAVNVTPATTTTFTLTVTNAAGTSATSTAVVTVVAAAPVITSFTAGANTITAGGSTTLMAVFSGGTGSVNNGVGVVTSGTPVTVIPAATTTYTLTVQNGAGSSTTASATVSVTTVTLVSIALTPSNPSVAPGATVQLAATGTYSDSTTRDLTGSVTWISSNLSVATIASGLATGVAVGVATIQANSGPIYNSNQVILTVPGPGTFTPTGSMTTARDPFTATLLQDGTVLMAGGIGTGGLFLQSAELYDSGGQTASAIAASMTSARAYHTATLLNNGMVLLVGGCDGSQGCDGNDALSSAELYDPAHQTFTATGSMGYARQDHTATLLSDGTVLIVGGYNCCQVVATAELFDPGTGQFSTVGNLQTARYSHTATLLNDATVLVAGGVDPYGNPLRSAELYRPASGTFRDLSLSFASLNYPRSSHTSTLLKDGTVLLAGGDQGGDATSTAEIYDPIGVSFYLVGNLNISRENHIATPLYNGMVLVAGGANCSGCVSLANTELYDPTQQTFTPAGNMQTARQYHTATLLTSGAVLIAGGVDNSTGTPTTLASAELFTIPQASSTWIPTGGMSLGRDTLTATQLNNGKVLVIGGNNGIPYASAELYNPADGVFSPTGSMHAARLGQTATLLKNGQVLVTGGISSNFTYPTAAELYDPATGTFSQTVGNMITGRAYHTATLLYNGQVLIAGGQSPSGDQSSAEIYDPASGTFFPTWSMQVARDSATATLLNNGKVLITGGGFSGGGSFGMLSEAETYDPSSGKFTVTGSMAAPRVGHSATLLSDGRVLVIGGSNEVNAPGFPRTYYASTEVYDPAAGQFTANGTLSTPRQGHGATLLANGKVLVEGGYSGTASAEIYDALTGTSSPTGSMNTARYDHGVVLLQNGKVLVVGGIGGGGSAELYQPAPFVPLGAITSVSVAAASPSVPGGLTDQFTATGNFSDGTQQNLTLLAAWSSSNTTQATITATGLATGLVPGTPTITASYAGITSSPFTLTVTPPLLVSIAVTSSTPAVVAGFTDRFTAMGTFSDGSVKDVTSTVTWSSSTTAANINASGLATGMSAGVTTITASSAAVSNSASLTVYPQPVSIAITPTVASIGASSTLQFTATGTNSDNTTQDLTSQVTWISSNALAATITSGASGGLASGISKGSAIISAALGALSSNAVTLTVAGFGPATGSLNIGRSGHSGVLLQDGRVLIVGANNVAPSELYDPTSGTFSLSGALIYVRSGQTATLLPNGNVLVAGGYYSVSQAGNGGISASEELYDPATGTFSATGSLVTARTSHTATLLPNGKVLIAGGWAGLNDTTASAELYDPATGTFSVTGSMVTGRGNHTATLLPNGKVLIAGGQSVTGPPTAQIIVYLASAELYDPATGAFSATGNMTDARLYHTAMILNTGKVLVAGGQGIASFLTSAELYDPTSGTFSPTGSLLAGRNRHSATLLNNGQVLITGGGLSSIELYDPAAGTFSSGGGMMTARFGHTATLLTNGNVLAAGGGETLDTLGSAELYVPDSLTPPTVTSISVIAANLTVSAGQSQSFVATDQNGQQLASVTWSSSNTAIAIIGNDGSDSGVAFGVAAGTSTIQACAGTVCGSATVTVTGGGTMCSPKTGNYVNPVAAVDTTSDPLQSPKGTYTVSATIDNTNQLTTLVVTLTSTGKVLLTMSLPITTNWGFSPDEGRFVFHYVTGVASPQVDNVYVYDLTASPARAIVQLAVATSADRLQFSPSGRYFLYTDLQSASLAQMQVFLLQGVTTQTLVYQDSYAFAGGDTYGGVSWGFSPDEPETSFVYAFATPQGWVQWNVLNLGVRHLVQSQSLTGAAAFWKYNPSGNIIALVTQASLAMQQVQISLYGTSTGLALAGSGQTIPSLSFTLETTASGQEVVYGSQTQLLSSVTCP